MKYKKKPVEVEAIQLTDLSYAKVREALEFMGQSIPVYRGFGVEQPFDRYMEIVWKNNGVKIETPSGSVIAFVGDYIIKGVNGEFYPCKPDTFNKTYELVEE